MIAVKVMLSKDNHNGIINNIFNVDSFIVVSRFKSRKYAEKILLNIKCIFLCGVEYRSLSCLMGIT